RYIGLRVYRLGPVVTSSSAPTWIGFIVVRRRRNSSAAPPSSQAAPDRTPPAASSGAAAAIGKVLPDLDGRLTGAALRVPVPVGSITDLTVVLERSASIDEVNNAFREAAAGDQLSRYLQYSEA